MLHKILKSTSISIHCSLQSHHLYVHDREHTAQRTEPSNICNKVQLWHICRRWVSWWAHVQCKDVAFSWRAKPVLRADVASSNQSGLTRPSARIVHTISPWTRILPPVRPGTAQSLDNLQDRTPDLENAFECPEPLEGETWTQRCSQEREQTKIYKPFYAINVSIALRFQWWSCHPCEYHDV